MNLPASLIALALLGWDDPRSQPASNPAEPVAIETRDKTPKAGATDWPDLIRQRTEELKQFEQTGVLGGSLAKTPKSVAKPGTNQGPEVAENWPMTVHEAIRIGLDNGDIVRVVAVGAPGVPVLSGTPPTINLDAVRVIAGGAQAIPLE
jgi:hypothetical protein